MERMPLEVLYLLIPISSAMTRIFQVNSTTSLRRMAEATQLMAHFKNQMTKLVGDGQGHLKEKEIAQPRNTILTIQV